MSINESRAEKSEAQFRRSVRSGSSNQQRGFSGGGRKGGGGTAPPPSSSINSSASLSTNKSYKKINGQGGQSKTISASATWESNAGSSRTAQNGPNIQPPLHGASDAPVSNVSFKPTNAPTQRSTQAVPAPSSQSASGASESMAPTTPTKGDLSKAFPLQFGTISPGFMNGMQIPPRTSSAPPKLDEQKRDQARHDSFRAMPTLPIPPVPKQQQLKKDVSGVNQSNTGESHPSFQVKRDMHALVPTVPGAIQTQKSSVLPVTGMSTPMPFQQPQAAVKFGGPKPQIQSQGMANNTSLQMPMPLVVGNTTQIQQQVFVPSLQSHPLQHQGMMHQGQSFAPQMGHQLTPQLGNSGMGITPQFLQQHSGTFGSARKPVKITHPETHEELRLDKRTDSYLDGGSSSLRSHPNAPPQSQPIPSFTPAHQNYYPPIQPNSFNTPIFFQSPTSHPLTNMQMTPNSPASRFTYQVNQGPQTLPFMNHSAFNPLPVTKSGTSLHSIAEPSNLDRAHDAHTVASSAPSASILVTVKPASGSLEEKSGSLSFSVSSPVNKGESPKLLRPPGEASLFHPQKDSEIPLESSVQFAKHVPEPLDSIPLSVTAKHSAAASAYVSIEKLPPSTLSSAPAVLPEESAPVLTNTESRRKEPVRRSNSTKDQQKKSSKREIRHSQPQHQTWALVQADASDSAGSSKSSSLKSSGEASKCPEIMQAPPLKVVGTTTSLKDGNSESVVGKGTATPSETCEGILESTLETLPGVLGSVPGASEAVTDIVLIGKVSTCEPSNTSCIGTVSDILDAVHHAKQDGCTLQVVQLKQETVRKVEQGKTELLEGSSHDNHNFELPAGPTFSESLEVGKQTEQGSNLKETTVGNESGAMETEQKELNEEAVACSLEVDMDNLTDNFVSNDTKTDLSSLISSTASCEDKTLNLDGFARSDSTNSKEVAFTESGMLQSTPVPTSFPSDTVLKLEVKGAENTTCDSISISVSGSQDKPTLEPNKANFNIFRGKKLKKEILQKADAAGTTSDPYMAYKGTEEKQETVISSESKDGSSCINMTQVPADGTVKDSVVASDGDGKSKAEPDDWEDAAEISSPKLKTLNNGERNRGGLAHHNEVAIGVMGKKYSRDFLLTISEQCTDLPAGFDKTSDIAETLLVAKDSILHFADRESYPSSGRIVDRSTGGSRPDRHGSGMMDDDKRSKLPSAFASGWDLRQEISHGGTISGFRPGQGGNHGVLGNPRGQTPGQNVGGILSGPMQSLASHGGMQRNSADADRWQRATGIQRGLIPYPQTPLQAMHKAEKKYEVGKVSDKEEAKQRQLKAILNKLTPQNFDKLFEQVKEVNIDNAVTLTGVISQIFDKALTEPTFCEMYANFCHHLAGELPDFSENNEKITFKRLLLNKCQEEFEKGEREQAEANRVEEEGEIKLSAEEREVKKTQARRRMLGNIRLIGELYKKKMLTERIMHECIQKLLGQNQNADEEDVESLCKLMSTIGEMIDHPKAKEYMDAYFDMMMKLSNNMKLSSRVRFMLKDAIDLRKNKWQQRRKVEGPKKIEEVHRDAAQERQAQSSRLARGSGINSSARRGQPMDFGLRGSTMLSSPNAQMGGFRGLPSQARGFGAQDVRLEERHPYESRTVSVPLQQRPIDDDSITLGPQGGLGRGMSIRPLMPSVPLVDISPNSGDSRRMAAGPNGYGSASGPPYDSREELMQRYIPERFTGGPVYDQSNSQERNMHFGNKDLRITDHLSERSMGTSPATRLQGSSAVVQNVPSEKVLPEEDLREKSIAAIREYYRYLLVLCMFLIVISISHLLIFTVIFEELCILPKWN
ncbi:hypothetical protein HHK36_028592 [Tetracentron sinense]|uniref:MIF4G domain-containing protein n=1 Tax=Tetracentron sinense TaxID=13715 RepID=A0A834YBB5_TETSI|nr:hypothetical protein HHK36_028592 [Tetracentron sinense]